MHRRIALRLLVALVAVLAMAGPVSAGGWATVHLDAAPENVAVEVPVRIGFTVLQHDTHPVNVDEATLEARHRETDEDYSVAAAQEGDVGHYVVEAVFPRAGEWKWGITPAPFAATSFETLTVLAAPAAGDAVVDAQPAEIVTGTCAELGTVVSPLANPADEPTQDDSAEAAGRVGSPAGLPVGIVETTVDVTMAELLSGPHAITVDAGAPAPVCGDIGGRMWDGALVVGLQALGSSGETGVATLREEAGRTTVTLYLLPAPTTVAEPAKIGSAQTIAVDIVDNSGNWGFNPTELTVAAGTTVAWTNATAVAHTITGDDLAFDDSGLMNPGDTFHQTFAAPGAYTYRCGPHPDMVATITVT